MARDAVSSVVATLRSHGFDPRKVGRSSWESRCPGHKSAGRALTIRRGPGNRAVLKCRSPEDCPPARILNLLGLAHDSLIEETTEPMTTDVNATGSSPHPSNAPNPNGSGAAIVSVTANGSLKAQWAQSAVPVIPAISAPASPPSATGIPPVDSSPCVAAGLLVTAADGGVLVVRFTNNVVVGPFLYPTQQELLESAATRVLASSACLVE
jgi:hypothetical protein